MEFNTNLFPRRDVFVAANQNQIAVLLTTVSFSVSRAYEMACIRVKLQEPEFELSR